MSTELNDVIAFIKGGIRPRDYDYKWLPQAIRMSFCKEHDLEYFNIGMYHGTDKLIFDMDKDVRLRYRDALKRYVDACLQCKDLKPLGEAACYSEEIRNGDPLYEYQSLYFTPSLIRALAYANAGIRGIKFGELGQVARGFKKCVEKQRIVIDIDQETIEIIDELYDFFKDKKEPEAMILKLKPEAIRKFSANESGQAFDEKQILKLEEKYIHSAFTSDELKNDFFDGWTNTSQRLAYRYNEDITSDDYEILDSGELCDKEAERTRSELKRVFNEAKEYIDSFCRDKGKLLLDEKFLSDLKEQFPVDIEDNNPNQSDKSNNSYGLDFFERLNALDNKDE